MTYGLSNRWGWHYTPKTCVEDCRHIDIKALHPTLVEHRQRGHQAPTITLPATGQVIDTTTTSPHFGGVRFWFLCPRCGGRCRKLYLPPATRRVACRTCHNLTYRSAQDARKHSGAIAALAQILADIDRAERVAAKLTRARVGSNRWAHWLRLHSKYVDRLNHNAAQIETK